MRKHIFLAIAAIAVAPTLGYSQTVSVDPTLASPNNTTTFNSLMMAINSFQTLGKITAASPGGVGVNSGNPLPDVINVVSGTTGVVDEIVRIDERPASAGYAILGEALTIQGPGAGAAPSAANNAYVALRDDGTNDDDGFELRTEQDITVKNVTFYPSLTTPPGDDMVTVDRLTPGLNANHFVFQSCVFTTAKTGNLPIVTNKTEALVNNRANIATPATAQDKLLSVFPDANEAMVCDIIDCVFSHSIDNDAILESSPRYTDAASTFALNIVSSVISYNGLGATNRYGIQIFASGTANAERSALNISGANVANGPVAGLGGPTIILGNGRGIQSFAGNSTDPTEHFALNISNTIVASNVERQLSMDANIEPAFSDLITSGPVPFVVTFEANTKQANWNRISAIAGSAASLFGAQNGDPNSLKLRDTIWAGDGTTAKAFDVFGTGDLKIDIDNSAIVLEGPHKVLEIGGTSDFTSGTTMVTSDPQFVSKDPASASFADVNSCAYAGKGTGGSDLSGGATFTAVCAAIREWFSY